jgi:hypothetical protein
MADKATEAMTATIRLNQCRFRHGPTAVADGFVGATSLMGSGILYAEFASRGQILAIVCHARTAMRLL